MPSTEKLPSGKFRGLYRDAAGNKLRVPGTFDRKSDAKDAAIDAESKAKRQAAVARGTARADMTFAQWWDDVLLPQRQFDSDNGRTERDIVRKYLRPKWGDVALNAIDRPAVQAWIDQLCREGKKPTYVRRIVAVFRVSVRAAVRAEVLTADPCSELNLPAVPKKARAYVSLAELAAMQRHLDQPWKDAVALLLETGMRPGELCGLHEHRTRGGILTIADVLVPLQRKIREWPKDGEVRTVPLSATARAIVARRLDGRNLRSGCGLPHIQRTRECKHSLVFVDAEGDVLTPLKLWRAVVKAAEAAELDRRTPYSARRGFATRLAEAGLDAFALADLMGHSDVAQTRQYVQQTPAAHSRTLLALGDKPTLEAVPDVGQRGTDRGTDRDNQALPAAPTEDDRQTS